MYVVFSIPFFSNQSDKLMEPNLKHYILFIPRLSSKRTNDIVGKSKVYKYTNVCISPHPKINLQYVKAFDQVNHLSAHSNLNCYFIMPTPIITKQGKEIA